MATPGWTRRTVPCLTSSLNGARADVHRWAWRYRSGGLQFILILYVLSATSAAPTATIVPTSSATSNGITTAVIRDSTRQFTPAVVPHKPTSEKPRLPGNVQVLPRTTRQPAGGPQSANLDTDSPSIQRSPETKTVAIGEKVTFRCQPVGEELEVTWEKDGQSIPRNPRYIVKSNYNLRVTNISVSDSGMFRCRAENVYGVAYSLPAFLNVQIPAKIVGKSQNLNVSFGTMVNLTCPAIGNPKPNITWTTHQDLIINWDPQGRSGTVRTEPYYSFNATTSDNYTCSVKNIITHQDGRKEPHLHILHHSVRVYNIPTYCASYGGNVCKKYLAGRSVWLDTNLYNPLKIQEPLLRQLSNQVDSIVMDMSCREAFKSLLCHSMLPDCNNYKPPRPNPLCREDCLTVRSDLCYHAVVELNKSNNEMLMKRLGPVLGSSQCNDLPSKEIAPGTCSDARLFEMEEDMITRDCVDTSNDGKYYQGSIGVTEEGLPCQPWTSSYPQSRRMFASVYPQLVNSSNYCRNPGGLYREPGCFPVGDSTEWQPCRIPSCDADTKTSTVEPSKPQTSTEKGEDDHAAPVTKAPYVQPVPKEPNSRRDIYLICGGAVAGVCFVVVLIIAVLFCHNKFGRYSRYKYPGDFDISKLPENPMYGKDFNKSFNPHLRHLEYPRNNIIYVVDIGEGAFGRVFKAIAPNLRPDEASTTVAVKMLKADADRNVHEFFNREAEIIARFDNTNVIKLFGVCFVGKPLCLLLEYMGQGDLQEFLHYRSANKSNPGGAPQLKNHKKLNLAYQVACGMVYLTEKRFVHRDIATRNCLVSNNNEVKISDFGLARYLGSSDQYLGHKDETIPIRWTAPEALWHYKFTTLSDVWSFGVLLWEIFSFARQPYENMSHEEVFLQTYKGHKLECPERTPHCVYELIQMCCSLELSARPSFYMVRDTLHAMQDSELVC